MLAAFLALTWGSVATFAYADEPAWRWVVVAPGGSGIDQFSGRGTVTIVKDKIEGVLTEQNGAIDPFRFTGTVDQEAKVRIILRWPNTDAGDVVLAGQHREYRNPNGTPYHVIWLLDAWTGIYLVMNRSE